MILHKSHWWLGWDLDGEELWSKNIKGYFLTTVSFWAACKDWELEVLLYGGSVMTRNLDGENRLRLNPRKTECLIIQKPTDINWFSMGLTSCNEGRLVTRESFGTHTAGIVIFKLFKDEGCYQGGLYPVLAGTPVEDLPGTGCTKDSYLCFVISWLHCYHSLCIELPLKTTWKVQLVQNAETCVL